MEWFVVKTGFEMFDALHAYGLGIFIATVSGRPTVLRDDGPVYHLVSRWRLFLQPSFTLFEVLFPLPTVDVLLSLSLQSGESALSVATLDGVLTALFTTGRRFLSVNDLLEKQRFDTTTVEAGIRKATRAVEAWKRYCLRDFSNTFNWVRALLSDYEGPSLAHPLPGVRHRQKDITATMTLDPAFGYSLRRPQSDGQIHRKGNVALHGTRYATVLAYLGAARFLRAQQVAGDGVNLCVPLAMEITLDERSMLELLPSTKHTPQQALACRLLSLFDLSIEPKEKRHVVQCERQIFLWLEGALVFTHKITWKALAYQTLQTQGIQQSVSSDRGVLSLGGIEEERDPSLIRFWQAWIGTGSERSQDEQEHLVDALLLHHAEAWLEHWCDVARLLSFQRNGVRRYHLEEVQRMAMSVSLSALVQREEGTLRFGRALRQLGRYNPSILRDILDQLETVQEREQLLLILQQAMHECVLAKAHTPFIRIPTEHDFAVLLADIEQHGVPLLARILMMLSALHYSHQDIDKYDVSILIGVLLALTAQALPPVENISLETPEPSTVNQEAPADWTTFSLDGGDEEI